MAAFSGFQKLRHFCAWKSLFIFVHLESCTAGIFLFSAISANSAAFELPLRINCNCVFKIIKKLCIYCVCLTCCKKSKKKHFIDFFKMIQNYNKLTLIPFRFRILMFEKSPKNAFSLLNVLFSARSARYTGCTP